VSRAALTLVGSKMKGGRSLCAVYMCARVYTYTHSHMYVSDRKRGKTSEARESHSERERGHTCEGMCASGCVCNGACVRSCIT